jgi:HEAT repeat protein
VLVRLAAARRLGMLGDNVGEQIVVDALSRAGEPSLDSQTGEQVRIQAAMAIGSIGTGSLRSYLLQLLEDESPFVRLAAAAAVLRPVSRAPIGP